MDAGSKKRGAPDGAQGGGLDKRPKPSNQWQKKGKDKATGSQRGIEAGDSGIWATCSMKQEPKCVREMYTILEEYVEKLHPDSIKSNQAFKPDGNIEDELQRELQEMKDSKKTALFESLRLDTACLVFFRTKEPIDPVRLTHAIVDEAAGRPEAKQSRYIKRLTPMSLMGKATPASLLEVATKVLAPHFHGEGMEAKKFSIRPNMRNHKVMSRDQVIQDIAKVVGPGHTVDLKNPDLIILVEVYQNVCGMSVVDGPEYERLKRYNITEIHDPTPKPEVEAAAV